jgi:hypothetical protein
MSTTNPAVRSIRIASTLNDRLGAIMREAGAGLRIAELELRIGEAQQIYPEIWRHLDEARAALATRSEVSSGALGEFDTVRATERPGEAAVGNIEGAAINSVPLPFPGMQFVQGKSATFNARGHAKAGEACNALMRALPDVDWQGLAKQDDAAIAEMGSLAAAKWRNAAIATVIVIAVIVALKALA